MQLLTCLSLIHDPSEPQGSVFVPGKVLRNHKMKPVRGRERRIWSKSNLRQLFLPNQLLVNTWTDRDINQRSLTPNEGSDGRVVFEVNVPHDW